MACEHPKINLYASRLYKTCFFFKDLKIFFNFWFLKIYPFFYINNMSCSEIHYQY